MNYVLDGQNVAAQTGARSVAYVSGAAGYVGQSENGAGLYYRANAHGDVVLVTDASGTVVNSYEYDAFGEAVASVETANVDVRYAGEFYDATTGQYYLRARYYDPSTGRFTSEDTYRGDPQNPSTLNLYAYCAGDPVNYVDPSGHKVSGISNWDKLSSQQKSNIESAERARKNGYISRSEYEANVKLNGGQVSSGGASGGSSSSGSSTSSTGASSGGGRATGGSRKGSTTSGTAKQNTPQEDELKNVIDEIESNAAADIAELEARKNSSAVTGTEDEEIAEILSGVEEAKSKLHQGLSGSRGNGKAASEQEKTAQFEGTEEEVRQQVRSQAMGILEGTVQVSWTEKEEEEEEKIEKIKESIYIGSNMGSFQPMSYQSFTEVDPFGGYTETNAGLFTLELLRLLALSKQGEDVGLSDDFLMYKIKKSPLMNYDLFAWAVKYYFDYLGYARFVDVQTLLLIGSFTNVAYYSKDVYLPDDNNIAETYPYGNRLLGEAYDVLRTSNLVNIFQWKGDGTNYWGRNWESEVPGSAQKVITKSSYNMNTNEGIIELHIWDQYQGQVKIAPNNITFEYMDGGPEIGFLSLPDGMELKGFKPYI